MAKRIPPAGASGGARREGGGPEGPGRAEAERVRRLELARHVKRRSTRALARHPRA
jgi:hypothetical protein